MNGQTNILNKKWIVYNTTDESLTGWHSFRDSYILDFSDSKSMFIKTLGESEIIKVGYYFNPDNGVIYEDNGEVLYCVKRLNTDRLILKMGENSNTIVSLVPLSDLPLKETNIINLLKNKKWGKDVNSLEFTDNQYFVADEIGTNFKIFIEQHSKSKAKFKGAWLIDSYQGLYFLELYSERSNFKSIYQIQYISETEIKAISTDKNGQHLLMELSAQ